MEPDQVAFYLGVAIILLGLGVWILRPPAPTTENKIKFLGLEVTLNTQAFVVVAFGIVLILLSSLMRGPAPVTMPHVEQKSGQSNPLENYCGSGRTIEAGKQIGYNGTLYSVHLDFTRGVEEIDPQACGREVWVSNNNLKYVYLVDGHAQRTTNRLYTENPDGTLR
jgi:hypothetical protein